MKKEGGTIDNYQIHNLSCTQEDIEKIYPGQNAKPMVFTGTVVKSPSGKLNKYNHMRSSLIVEINREKGIIETRNTMYKILNEGNDQVSDNMSKMLGKETSDCGDAIMSIFY